MTQFSLQLFCKIKQLFKYMYYILNKSKSLISLFLNNEMVWDSNFNHVILSNQGPYRVSPRSNETCESNLFPYLTTAHIFTHQPSYGTQKTGLQAIFHQLPILFKVVQVYKGSKAMFTQILKLLARVLNDCNGQTLSNIITLTFSLLTNCVCFFNQCRS